jgi:hypothetical protein
MIVKWALVAFAVAAAVLLGLGKVLALANPPRPGRGAPPLLRRVRRAARWSVGLLLVTLLLLAATLAGWL